MHKPRKILKMCRGIATNGLQQPTKSTSIASKVLEKAEGPIKGPRKDKIMNKTNKCANGCNDRNWDKYCKDCMSRLAYRISVKSIKRLKVSEVK